MRSYNKNKVELLTFLGSIFVFLLYNRNQVFKVILIDLIKSQISNSMAELYDININFRKTIENILM